MKSHTNQTVDKFPTLRFKLLLVLTPKRVYYQVLHNSLCHYNGFYEHPLEFI